MIKLGTPKGWNSKGKDIFLRKTMIMMMQIGGSWNIIVQYFRVSIGPLIQNIVKKIRVPVYKINSAVIREMDTENDCKICNACHWTAYAPQYNGWANVKTFCKVVFCWSKAIGLLRKKRWCLDGISGAAHQVTCINANAVAVLIIRYHCSIYISTASDLNMLGGRVWIF